MSSLVESLDSLPTMNAMDILRPLMNDPIIKTSLTVLAVFGENGSSVAYVTTDDRVYAYGDNRFGCLGLGTDKHVAQPTLNQTLTGKQVVNIFTGYCFCFALTASGQCYSWGINDNGQCGIGVTYPVLNPLIITGLADKRVVDIVCGNSHSMALTMNGQVYAWGRNTFGQVGDGTCIRCERPMKVAIDATIASISCGKNHSLALTRTGVLYVWGLNDFGQLGRHREYDIHEPKERAFCMTPRIITEFKDKMMVKAICGPNNTLVLESDGTLYAFGLNESGQIGNGTQETQFTPIAIPTRLKFKDIVTCFSNDLCVAMATNGKYYVWGYNYRSKYIAKPYASELQTGTNLLDIYYKYSNHHKTYKTIVFKCADVDKKPALTANTDVKSTPHLTCNGWNSTQDTIGSIRSGSSASSSMDTAIEYNDMVSAAATPQPTRPFEDNSLYNHTAAMRQLTTHLAKAFNNESNYDIKFIVDNKWIHCHKGLLQMRSKRFWELCAKKLAQNGIKLDEIHIKSYSYETIYSFIQCLYGLKPKITDQNVTDLLKLSTVCLETTLTDLCRQYLDNSMDFDTKPVTTQTIGGRNGDEKCAESKLIKHMKQSFNNPKSYDFRIIISHQIIYCHRNVLQICNRQLWQQIESQLDSNKPNEIEIHTYSYEVFKEFIGYLYGIEPVFSERLVKMAKYYGETIYRQTPFNGLVGLQSPLITNGLDNETAEDGSVHESLVQEFHGLFNNPDNYDLKFVFTDGNEPILCHKFILKQRNVQFWTKCQSYLKPNGEIDVLKDTYLYDTFYSFIQMLYGMAPIIQDHTCGQLLKLAKVYNEPILKDLCKQYCLL